LALSELFGKVIVVDVWATWCSPCRMMIPYFKQLEKELEGKKVIFGPAVCDEHLTIAFIEEEGIAIEIMELK
jgi:thiol-disulfide isomerase/thioredoxin